MEIRKNSSNDTARRDINIIKKIVEVWLFKTTYTLRFDKKDLLRLKIHPGAPYPFDLSGKPAYKSLSNAFEISIATKKSFTILI